MRRVLLWLVLWLAPLPCPGSEPNAPEARGPGIVVFETPLGPVSFGHARHGKDLAIECGKCHHPTSRGKMARQPCRDCHKKRAETVDGGPPSFYQVKMELCRGCHVEESQTRERKRAPVACEQCHDIKKMLKKP